MPKIRLPLGAALANVLALVASLAATPGHAQGQIPAEMQIPDPAAVPGTAHEMDGSALRITRVGPVFVGPDKGPDRRPNKGPDGGIWRHVTQVEGANGLFNTYVVTPDAIAQSPLRLLRLRADDVIDIVILDPRTSWTLADETPGNQLWQAMASDGVQVSLRINGKPDVMAKATPLPPIDNATPPPPRADWLPAPLHVIPSEDKALIQLTDAGHLPPQSLQAMGERLDLDSANGKANIIEIDLADDRLAGVSRIHITADDKDHVLITGASQPNRARMLPVGDTRSSVLLRKDGSTVVLEISEAAYWWVNREAPPARIGIDSPPLASSAIVSGNEHPGIMPNPRQPPPMLNLSNGQRDLFLLRHNRYLSQKATAYITGDAATDVVLLHPHSRWDTPTLVRDSGGKQWLEFTLLADVTSTVRIDPQLTLLTLPMPTLLTTSADLPAQYASYPGLPGGTHGYTKLWFSRGGPIWIDNAQLPKLQSTSAKNGLPNTYHLTVDNARSMRPYPLFTGDPQIDKVSLADADQWTISRDESRLPIYSRRAADGSEVHFRTDLAMVQDIPDAMERARRTAEAMGNAPGDATVLALAMENARIRDEVAINPHSRALLLEDRRQLSGGQDEYHLAYMDIDKLKMQSYKLGDGHYTNKDGQESKITPTRAQFLLTAKDGKPGVMVVAGKPPGGTALMALTPNADNTRLVGTGYGVTDGMIAEAYGGALTSPTSPLLLMISLDKGMIQRGIPFMAFDVDGFAGPKPPLALPDFAMSRTMATLPDGRIAMLAAIMKPPRRMRQEQRENQGTKGDGRKAWLAIITPDGTVERSFDWPGSMSVQALRVLPDGDMLISGVMVEEPPRMQRRFVDPYVTRISPDGTVKAYSRLIAGDDTQRIVPGQWELGANGGFVLVGHYLKDAKKRLNTPVRLAFDSNLTLQSAQIWTVNMPLSLDAVDGGPKRPDQRIWIADNGKSIIRRDLRDEPANWQNWAITQRPESFALTPIDVTLGPAVETTAPQPYEVELEAGAVYLRVSDPE